MGGSWSDKAETDLESINPIVKDQLRRNAEVTLSDIMLCRARSTSAMARSLASRITHEQEREAEWLWWEDDDGAQVWDYVLFYRRRSPTEFEVLGVRSTRQIAIACMQRTGKPPEPPDDVSHSERHAGHQRRPRDPQQVRGAGPYPAQWTALILQPETTNLVYESPVCHRAAPGADGHWPPTVVFRAEKSPRTGDATRKLATLERMYQGPSLKPLMRYYHCSFFVAVAYGRQVSRVASRNRITGLWR
jgi:hypothetical protein